MEARCLIFNIICTNVKWPKCNNISSFLDYDSIFEESYCFVPSYLIFIGIRCKTLAMYACRTDTNWSFSIPSMMLSCWWHYFICTTSGRGCFVLGLATIKSSTDQNIITNGWNSAHDQPVRRRDFLLLFSFTFQFISQHHCHCYCHRDCYRHDNELHPRLVSAAPWKRCYRRIIFIHFILVELFMSCLWQAAAN